MNFVTYKKIADNLLEISIDFPNYIQNQPMNDKECVFITLSVCALIDTINTNYSDCRQIIILNCLDVHISQVKYISYAYYIIKEIHKYTRDIKLLDKILIINYGNILLRFYGIAKTFLPAYIGDLVEFKKNEELAIEPAREFTRMEEELIKNMMYIAKNKTQ